MTSTSLALALVGSGRPQEVEPETLRRLEREGLVEVVDGAWWLTPEGWDALDPGMVVP